MVETPVPAGAEAHRQNVCYELESPDILFFWGKKPARDSKSTTVLFVATSSSPVHIPEANRSHGRILAARHRVATTLGPGRSCSCVS